MNAVDRKRKIVSFVLVIAMIAALCMSLTACGTPTVNMNDYLEVWPASMHYNGGHAVPVFDTNQLLEDYGDKISLTEDGWRWWRFEESWDDEDTDKQPAYALAWFLQENGELDRDKNLVNGDRVTYSWNLDEEGLEDYFELDFNISCEDKTFTMSGLSE